MNPRGSASRSSRAHWYRYALMPPETALRVQVKHRTQVSSHRGLEV
jgi:hypothetical protein